MQFKTKLSQNNLLDRLIELFSKTKNPDTNSIEYKLCQIVIRVVGDLNSAATEEDKYSITDRSVIFLNWDKAMMPTPDLVPLTFFRKENELSSFRLGWDGSFVDFNEQTVGKKQLKQLSYAINKRKQYFENKRKQRLFNAVSEKLKQ